jgi:hypothetical protein
VARSERFIVSLVFALATPAACAQVTGLSDDYTFDLDGGKRDGGEGGADGSSSGDAITPGKCSVADTSQAAEDISNANGDKIASAACRTCLAANCCSSIHACAGDGTCKDAMSCIFGCQAKPQNEKRRCLDGCNEGAFGAVGTCSRQDCQQDCNLN